MSNRLISIAAAALLICATSHAATLTVTNTTALEAAMSKAKAGDEIVMTPGKWTNAVIKIARGGTESKPIILRAQQPGKTILTGASSLDLAAPYVQVEGLLFQGGALKKGEVIHFGSDHDRISNCAIIDYNPPDSDTAYYWVFFEGNFNRMDHCLFKGKNHQEPVIGNAREKPSRHNTVDHCYFHNIPYTGKNGREIFRIWGYGGNEELGDDGAFFTIEDNLFEHADGEGMEIISLKSNRNIVRGNTIRASRGGITNRSGNFNRIEGNFIFGEGIKGAYGIRLIGQSHIVANNYIDGCEYGINVYAGEYFTKALTDQFKPILRPSAPLGRVPRYGQPKNDIIEHNTLINLKGPAFFIGGGYKSGWPEAQRILMPEGLRIEKNLVINAGGGVVLRSVKPDRSPPLDPFRFKPNIFRGNIISGGTSDLPGAKAGFATLDVKLTDEHGVQRPQDASSLDGAGIEPEYRHHLPLTRRDVGPTWHQ